MSRFVEVAQKMGAGPYAQPLELACAHWGVRGDLTHAHFLAQLYVESEGFTDLSEDFNYRPSRLLQVFYGRNGLTTIEEARAIIAGGPDAIAEAVYGLPWGVELGNTKPGDGARYPGRGLKQITGKSNYLRYSMAQYGDDRVLKCPSMLLEPYDAAESAAWFFKISKAWNAALADNVRLVTRRINGGYNALDARIAATLRAKRLFGL